MKKQVLTWLTSRIGRYYFIEIEEIKDAPSITLTRHRVVIRALFVSHAVQAAFNQCRMQKEKDGKDYTLSVIHKV